MGATVGPIRPPTPQTGRWVEDQACAWHENMCMRTEPDDDRHRTLFRWLPTTDLRGTHQLVCSRQGVQQDAALVESKATYALINAH